MVEMNKSNFISKDKLIINHNDVFRKSFKCFDSDTIVRIN